jgi:NAD(P)-dependent dehydrogenase (short-subunit alcohol dehydrogenase family)
MTRIALITGAAQGLGRAIAERLAADGMGVVIADIQQDVAQRTADEFTAAGSTASVLPLDVTDEASVAQAYAEIERRYGQLHILVNNAGVAGLQQGKRATIKETSLDTWEHTLSVNLTGTFLMCRGAVPIMRRGSFGRIVNMSSTSGLCRFEDRFAGPVACTRSRGRWRRNNGQLCRARTRTHTADAGC